MRKLFISLLMVCSIAMSATDYYASSFGYGESATGGTGGEVITVNNATALTSAVNKRTDKRIVIITQSIEYSSIATFQDFSNVTILGMPGVTLTNLQQNRDNSGVWHVKRASNVIIRNLTFIGPGAYDCDGKDLLCFEGVTNTWVDHCDFQDGCDGNFDNKDKTDNVTVSWCRFRYLKPPKAGGSGGSPDHRYTNLLGSSADDKPSDGTFNMTWAYCWWDNGCVERMLRCRNASLHFLNCYWNSNTANYYIGPENIDAYIEGCTFEGGGSNMTKESDRIFYENYGGTNGVKYVNSVSTVKNNTTLTNITDRAVVTPSYAYTALTAAESKTAITDATCGAGATLVVTTDGTVSSACEESTDPAITIDPTSVSMTALVGTTAPYKDVSVKGRNLESNISVSSSNSKITATTQSGWNNTTGGTLRISINSTATAGTEKATITVKSGNDVSQTIAVTVTVKEPEQFTVTIEQPTGGTIAVTDADGNAIESGSSVLENTVLTLTNTPTDGYTFKNFTANGESTSSPYTVTGNVTISADFEAPAAGSILDVKVAAGENDYYALEFTKTNVDHERNSGEGWLDYSGSSYTAGSKCITNEVFKLSSSRRLTFKVQNCVRVEMQNEFTKDATTNVSYSIDGGTATVFNTNGSNKKSCATQSFDTNNTGLITITISATNDVLVGTVKFYHVLPGGTCTAWPTDLALNAINLTVGDSDASLGLNKTLTGTTTFTNITSNNTAVATIVNGKVHAVGAGTTTITATANNDAYCDGTKQVTGRVTVTAAAVTPPVTGEFTTVCVTSAGVQNVQPMTGLVLWPDQAERKNATYNKSIVLEYAYCLPCDVVTGKSGDAIQYNWSTLESLLNDVKSRGHQAVLRFRYEYPNGEKIGGTTGATAVPAYIKALSGYNETYSSNPGGDGPTYYADWSNSELQWFTKQFYTDFNAKYGNDPRIAFIEIGFGHWSEYHIYGTDLDLGNNFPSHAYQKEFLQHMASVMTIPWSVSIDAADDTYSPIVNDNTLMALNFGLFDDSFMHEGHESSSGEGYNEECWNAIGKGTRWQTGVCGGEISYYTDNDQKNFLNPSGMYGVTWEAAAAKYHITFMIANDAPEGSIGTAARFKEGSMATGYKFKLMTCETNGSVSRITMTNTGVAPIYRDAFVTVGGVRASESLKGLLPGETKTFTVNAAATATNVTIESDYILPTQTIEYDVADCSDTPITPEPDEGTPIEGLITNDFEFGSGANASSGRNWASTITTKEPTKITSLSALSPVGFDITDHSNRAGQTVKVHSSGTTKNTGEYMQLSFTVADGYALHVTDILVQPRAVSSDGTFDAVLTDGASHQIAITGRTVPESSATGAEIFQASDFAANPGFVGNVTLKIYAYGSQSAYRYNDNVVIDGYLVESIPSGTTQYTVSYTQPTGGVISVTNGDATVTSGTKVDENTELTISATANTGYELTSLTVNDNTFPSGNTHKVTSATTIVATFTPLTYTITYDANGGSTVANGSYTYGAGLTQLPTTTREGYTFTGWYDASNNQVTSISNTQIGNITLTAQWTLTPVTPTTYAVTVTQPTNGSISVTDADGNAIADLSAVAEGTQIKVTVTPDTGYELDKLTIGGTDYTTSPQTITVNGDIAITATINKTASAGGGDCTPTTLFHWQATDHTDQKSPYNFTQTLSGGTMSWTGASGKNLKGDVLSYVDGVPADMQVKSGEGIRLDSGDGYLLITLTDNTIQTGDVIQICGNNTYKMSDEIPADGTKLSTTKWDVVTGTSLETCAIGTFTFPDDVNTQRLAIKRTSASCIAAIKITRPCTSAGTDPEPNKFAVTITANAGGSVSVMNGATAVNSGDEVDENTELTITATPNEGYKLATLTVNDNTFTSGNMHKVTSATTVEATFSPLTYTITYDANGGNAVANGSYTYGTGLATLPAPTREGYTFDGWYDASNNQVTSISNTQTGNITLTAQWTENTPTLETVSVIVPTDVSNGSVTVTYADGTAIDNLLKVTKGSYLIITAAPANAETHELESLTINGTSYESPATVEANEDLEIAVSFKQKSTEGGGEDEDCGTTTIWIDATSTTSDDLFPIVGSVTEYSYSSDIVESAHLIELDKEGGSFIFKNNKGYTISAITVYGCQENSSPHDGAILLSDGTAEFTTGTVSWGSRKGNALSEYAIDITGLDCSVGTQYTISNEVGKKGAFKLEVTYKNPCGSDPAGTTLTFEGKEDDSWSNAANWAPNYNVLPTINDKVIINQPVVVSANDAHCAEVLINTQGAGHITIAPIGGLSVLGTIRAIHGDDTTIKYATTADDILIQSSATAQGALAYKDQSETIGATVEYYSRAYGATTTSLDNALYQYMGIPLHNNTASAISDFHKGWMFRWNEPDGMWYVVSNDEVLHTFMGYSITQETAKTYTLQGNLVPSGKREVQLQYTSTAPFAGQNLITNSWMAPLQLEKFETTDFIGADPTMYIFETGSYSDWQNNHTATEPTDIKNILPGQYLSLPVKTAAVIGFPAIAPMQAFFVMASDEGSLTLDYERLCFNSAHTLTTHPMRTPAAVAAEPEKCVIAVQSEHGADRVFLLQKNDYTDQYTPGYDGYKIYGGAALPYLAAITTDGDMNVWTTPSLIGTQLNFFKAADDTQYTIGFEYNGTQQLCLRDHLTQQEVEIRTGNTYTFTDNSATEAARFEIVKKSSSGDVATDLLSVSATADALYLHNPAAEAVQVNVFTVDGKLLQSLTTSNQLVELNVPANGVYLIHLTTEHSSRVLKQIYRRGE